MIKFAFIFFISLNLLGQNWIDYSEIIQIEDTIYSKKNGLPYTGLITKSSDNSRIIFKARAVKGIYNGNYIRFFENGDTLEKGTYKNGKLHRDIYNYIKGNSALSTIAFCWLKTTFDEGIRSGKSESYYENGNIYISTFYINDEENGICSVNYSSGEIYATGQFKAGIPSSEWFIYNKDKSINAVLRFYDGIVINCAGECSQISELKTDFNDLLLNLARLELR